MNQNDLRYIKTDELIRKSFINCVNKYGFEKTKITMICDSANIGRKTFYLHYLDKYNLLDTLFNEFHTILSESLKNASKKENHKKIIEFYVEKYFDCIEDNRENFLFLAKCSKEKMEKVLGDIIVEEPLRELFPNNEKPFDEIKTQLDIHYMFSAIMGFTEFWLKNIDKISKEETISEYLKLCNTPAVVLYGKFEEQKKLV